MKQIKWFDRKFDFASEQNIFPAIIERLEGTAVLLKHKLASIPKKDLIAKPDNTWSIQENVGHLLDLEPLWYGRLEDILLQTEYLRSADLKNKKTDLAGHNERNLTDILEEFTNYRTKMLARLKNLNETEIFRHALHPRLIQPMRTMDLFLFVAEHDDHHLARISELQRKLAKG
ncbi:MAG: DinB family protein [Bacteroidota bacterium]